MTVSDACRTFDEVFISTTRRNKYKFPVKLEDITATLQAIAAGPRHDPLT